MSLRQKNGAQKDQRRAMAARSLEIEKHVLLCLAREKGD
jgi:hypothetical protein